MVGIKEKGKNLILKKKIMVKAKGKELDSYFRKKKSHEMQMEKKKMYVILLKTKSFISRVGKRIQSFSFFKGRL